MKLSAHLPRRARTFLLNESGAVTTEWVVLTAGIVGLAIIVVSGIGGGTENISQDIVTEINVVAGS